MIINNSFKKRGQTSFGGDPNGFAAFPQGTLFRRKYFKYKVMLPGKSWVDYTQLYYEPKQIEYENDSKETVWFKTTDESSRSGWTVVKNQTTQQQVSPLSKYYLISVGDNQYLSVDGENQFITFNE